MSFINTAQELKTILDTVSASILPLKFDYQETQPSSFPAGMVIFLRGREEILDTITNQVFEQFVIRIIFAQEERQAAMQKWATLIDALATEFGKDDHQTLSGKAVHFMVKTYDHGPSIEYVQPVHVFDIGVEARTLRLINA